MATNLNTTDSNSAQVNDDDVKSAEQLAEVYEKLRAELGRVIIGQDTVLKEVMIALFAKGHCLREGVPGLAKTLLVQTVAQALGMCRAASPSAKL